MNSRQKQVQQALLVDEKEAIARLRKVYANAQASIDKKVQALLAREDANTLTVIYQVQHQQALRDQVSAVLDLLQADEFTTISDYLEKCYTNGYTGAMYDITGQIGAPPVILAPDPQQVVRAVRLNSKISINLYTKLGENVTELKRKISATISRGISTGMGYGQMATLLSRHSSAGFSNSMRIIRTEGHRIQVQSGLDACQAAKDNGCDVVKQWDATLDGRTRPHHRQLDGQLREIDDPFDIDGKTAAAPGMFGSPAEDCNCRCALLQRARWALDEDELQALKERAEFYKLDKTKDFEDFRAKYLEAAKQISSGQAPPVMVGGVSCTTRTEKFSFGDGTSTGVKKTVGANIYTTPDGVDFVFPKRYDKKKQTMTPDMAIQNWQKVPQNIRVKAQKTIEFVDYYNPQDSYWRSKYKNFPHSYATGGNEIVFYRYDYPHDPDYLVHTYCHEAGHFIDMNAGANGGRFSEGPVWTKAMADDIMVSGKKSPTAYGENAAVEDFADSVAEYVADEKTFRKNFPNRAAALASIL